MTYCQHCGKSCDNQFGRYMPNDGTRCGPYRVYCEPSGQDAAYARWQMAKDHLADMRARVCEAEDTERAAREQYHEANQAFLDSEDSKS